jgi:hypothetical protein
MGRFSQRAQTAGLIAEHEFRRRGPRIRRVEPPGSRRDAACGEGLQNPAAVGAKSDHRRGSMKSRVEAGGAVRVTAGVHRSEARLATRPGRHKHAIAISLSTINI